eukprot:7332016-Karenia_brevis.AAC.1
MASTQALRQIMGQTVRGQSELWRLCVSYHISERAAFSFGATAMSFSQKRSFHPASRCTSAEHGVPRSTLSGSGLCWKNPNKLQRGRCCHGFARV